MQRNFSSVIMLFSAPLRLRGFFSFFYQEAKKWNFSILLLSLCDFLVLFEVFLLFFYQETKKLNL